MMIVVFGMLLLGGAASQSPANADFRRDIAPIFENRCTSCHHESSDNRLSDLTSHQGALAKKSIVPGHPERSPLYLRITNGSMPPDGKLRSDEIEAVRKWIAAGAEWPDTVKLQVATRKPSQPAPGIAPATDSEMQNVERIRARILQQQAAKGKSVPSPYTVTIPNTTVSYGMVSVPAGEFTMGSAASDPSRQPDEQPAHKVRVNAFWMQVHEVTWDEYRLFMFAKQANEIALKDDTVDAVSRPTRPYVEMSFGMGINGFPAISMTQHAANKYAEWLSAKTGEFYRLPTEAEWEYACRAGSAAPFFFGNDASQLADYAWYSANAQGKYQKVATKKPNSWGLYDMLGNVMEWTLDAYGPYKPDSLVEPWMKVAKPYPIAVRGGSWNDPAEKLRCAARVASDPSWKQQDPQLPKSIWYETDAQWLGFRLIRTTEIPGVQEMYKYWNNGVEHDEQ
jgi:formylglycine-generating enzyme required for sulfatase activity